MKLARVAPVQALPQIVAGKVQTPPMTSSFWVCSDVLDSLVPLLLPRDACAIASASKGARDGFFSCRTGLFRADESGSVRCTRPCERERCLGTKRRCDRSDGHPRRCLCKCCFHELGIQPQGDVVWCHYCYTRIRGVSRYDQHGNALHFGCWLVREPPKDGQIARTFV